MEDNINNYKYDDSVEDLKLRSFVEQSFPKKMDSNSIKQKTFMKIHDEQRRSHRRQWARVSVAACILLTFVCLGLWKILDTRRVETLTACTKKMEMQHIIVPVGEKMTIMLSDGTKLVANSRTTLSYPKTFQGAERREVSIKGEAYLEVAHDAEHPFVVNSGKFKVKVLGTRFNISNYDDSKSSVVLAQGSVEITTDNKDLVRMKPSEKVVVKNGSFVEKTQVDAQDYTSWMDGVLTLQGESVNDIAEMLSQYYGVKIVCNNVNSTPLYGKLVLQDSVMDVLKTIKGMVKIKTIRKNGEIYIVTN